MEPVVQNVGKYSDRLDNIPLSYLRMSAFINETLPLSLGHLPNPKP